MTSMPSNVRSVRRLLGSTSVAVLVALSSAPDRLAAQDDFNRCQPGNAATLAQAASHGNAEASYCVGFFQATGRAGYARDVGQAVASFRRAADRGFAPAQAYMGYFYKHGEGVTRDYAEAARWYRKAADQGHAGAQNDLGILYLEGNGVSKDQAEALKWLRRSAEQGNPSAQTVLATIERGGHAAPRAEPAADRFEEGRKLYASGNQAGAVRPFMEAAKAGNSMAQVQIGYQYEYGEGLPQNGREAAGWYRRAAELGNPAAECNLGHLYEAGTGVAEDWVAAAEWYRKGADRHFRRCEASVARAYRFGIGVPQNRGLAVSWYQRAGTGAGYDPESAYWAKWLSSSTNNIGFRDQAEHDLVIGGKLRFGLLGGDASGMLFHNSAERARWLMGQRREVDVREARTMWGIAKNEYDSCQRNGGGSCVNPGAEPR